MNNIIKKIIKINNKEIIIEAGKVARQSDGAVIVKMDNAILLSTIVYKKDKNTLNFLPLSVDYQEKFAAAGKIPGGFLKREGRLDDHEIVISRLVDRVIRPFFLKGFNYEIQINISLISADSNILPDALAALAASSAICVSNIPFHGPVSEVRVARLNGKFLVNPNPSDLDLSDIDLIIGGTESNISMLEGEMDEISESEIISIIKFGHNFIKIQCKAQGDLISDKLDFLELDDQSFEESIFIDLYNKVSLVYKKFINNKKERNNIFNSIKNEYIENNPSLNIDNINICFNNLLKQVFRDLVLKGLRVDGRKLDEIRPISIELNYLPSSHGSTLFTRGETQSLTTVTLGNKFDEQIIDRVMQSGYNKFILHYNFPGFSTGELKSNKFSSSRREVGHGNLAMKSLKRILPYENKNPYTIRVVSDILESNGSSSMATICAGSLALMDAGINIKYHVSGIAMGVFLDKKSNNYVILSDILGEEDFYGDMDFKISGTFNGITACQMDVKVNGFSYDILTNVLDQAKKGRFYILDIMNKSISSPVLDYKNHVPRASIINISKDMIGSIIGASGKVIQDIKRETGANIIVEEIDNGGIVKIFASNKNSLTKAERRIKSIILQPVIGDIYLGKVKAIFHFGAFIEFMPGKDGLLHISEVK
jgi:polyribonucleotide nucleotidyltransferase